MILAHPDFHAGGHFKPLEKNGIKIRGRFQFLFSRAKNLGGPLGPKNIVFKLGFIVCTRFQRSKR